MDRNRKIILLLILATAAVLRFYNFSDWSLSNDELSSWLRLQYSSLSEVLKEGVRPDFHPAGVQVFMYYWIKIFGDSPFALRLPAVIFGILGVWMTFKLGKKWFGTNAGLMAAAAMCFLQLPLLYSQIARPYSSGMLFGLCMVYFWSNVLFSSSSSSSSSSRKRWLMGLGYGVFTALCMYDHYFCFMLAGLVGITGFFFLDKGNWKVYLLSGLGAIVLFLPHIGISIEQLSRGGLESWLGPPEEGYLGKFLMYCVHDSWVLGMILLSLVVLPLFTRLGSAQISKYHYISISWFTIIYFTGYFYSLYVSPVLQYSVLIFVFPFLVLFLFSFYGEGESKIGWIIPPGLLAAGIFIVTIGTGFYSKQQFGVFKELAEKTKEWDGKYGKENVSKFFNTISPDYLNYYFKQLNYFVEFNFQRGDDPEFIYTLQKAVFESKGEYFIYGWSNNRHPNEALAIILNKFKVVADYRNYFNSQVILFKKEKETEVCFSKITYYQDIDKLSDLVSEKIDSRIDSLETVQAEYYNLYKVALGDLMEDSCKYMDAKAVLFNMDSLKSLILVSEIKRKDSVIFWKGADLRVFSHPAKMNNHKLFSVIKMEPAYQKTDTLFFYFWNKDHISYKPVLLSIFKRPEYNNLIYD